MLTAYACEGKSLRLITELTDEALRDAAWIDLLAATDDERARVARSIDLALPTEADISEIETSSRMATRGDALYMSMPLVSRVDADPRSISAGFVLTPHRLVTVRFAPSQTIDRFMQRVGTGEVATPSSAHVMVGLLEAIVDRLAEALEQVRGELDTISQRIFRKEMAAASGRKREDAMLRVTLLGLGRVGNLISYIRETQVTAERIVPFVEQAAEAWLPHDLHGRLETLRADIASLNSFNAHLFEKIQFLLDATLGLISIAQNNLMKVLTVASVVGIPPVLVAGIYGMNFKDMPELSWAYGYHYGLALLVVSALVPLIWFKVRGWL
jgi:magnesium transporter